MLAMSGPTETLTADQKRAYIVSRRRIVDTELGMNILRLVRASYGDTPGVILELGHKEPSIDLSKLGDEMVERIWSMVKSKEDRLGTAIAC
jgi:hypothetical protein